MWSCGVIVYILLGGYPPFHDDNHAILYRKIKAADYAFDPQYWDQVSDDAKDLITKILDQDPVSRYNPAQIRAHVWFQTRCQPVYDSPGLVVGQTHMLYEEVILRELESKGFPRDQVVRYLDANRNDQKMYPLIKRWMRAIFGYRPKTSNAVSTTPPANLTSFATVCPWAPVVSASKAFRP